MTLRNISRKFVIKAIEQFDELGLEEMLVKYDGGPSTKWYINYNGEYYDQKLICRAAHKLQGLGRLLVYSFKAGQARRKLAALGFDVKELND